MRRRKGMTVMDNEIRGEQEEEQREAEELGEPLPPDWEEPAREIDPEAAEEPEAQEAEPADQEAANEEAANEEAPAEAAKDEAATGEAKEGENPKPDGLRIVIEISSQRAAVGMIREGVDAHLEVLLEDDIQLISGELPGIMERALEGWENEPMRPKYEPPKKQTKRPAAKKDAKPKAGSPTTEAETEQQPLEQPLMNRLF